MIDRYKHSEIWNMITATQIHLLQNNKKYKYLMKLKISKIGKLYNPAYF